VGDGTYVLSLEDVRAGLIEGDSLAACGDLLLCGEASPNPRIIGLESLRRKSHYNTLLMLPYCCQAPGVHAKGSPFLTRFAGKKRADERTRTAFLLITSVRSVVAGRCTGLQIPLM